MPSEFATGAVTVQAVVLDDKTGDGDAIIFEDVRDTRLGQAVQIKRSLKLLEKYIENGSDLNSLRTEMVAALDRPELETLNAIKEIRSVGIINRKTTDALSAFVKEGLAAGTADVLRKVDQAKAKKASDTKDFLVETKTHYETLLTKL